MPFKYTHICSASNIEQIQSKKKIQKIWVITLIT